MTVAKALRALTALFLAVLITAALLAFPVRAETPTVETPTTETTTAETTTSVTTPRTTAPPEPPTREPAPVEETPVPGEEEPTLTDDPTPTEEGPTPPEPTPEEARQERNLQREAPQVPLRRMAPLNVPDPAGGPTATLRVEKSIRLLGAVDQLVGDLLGGEDYGVVARCVVPGQSQPHWWEGTVREGGTVTVGTFPVGTNCVLTERWEPGLGLLELLGALVNHPRFLDSSSSVTLTAAGMETVHLENRFSLLTGGGVTIRADMGSVGVPASELPDTVQVDYRCGLLGLRNGTLNIPVGETATVSNLLGLGNCTFTDETPRTEGTRWADKLTTWATTSERQDSLGDQSFRVDTGLLGLRGAAVNLTVTYYQSQQEISLSGDTELVDASGDEVAASIREAVLPTGQRPELDYRCTSGGTQVASGTVELPARGQARIWAPRDADCLFTPSAPELSSADGPEFDFAGTGSTEGDSRRVTVGESAASVSLTARYTLLTGGFQLDKRLAGEGDIALGEEHPFELTYVCRLNDVVVAEGSHEIRDSDDPADHEIAGVPVGTDCEITETPDSAEYSGAEWTPRWALDRDGEQWCDTVDHCAVDPADPHRVTLTVVALPGADADEHFQGTLTVQNTYLLDRVVVRVDKELAADGPELAAEDTFTFDLLCEAPTGDDDASISQTLEITGAGRAEADTPVPVGFDCTLREEEVEAYDAVVETSFGDAERVDDTTARFTTSPASEDGEEPQVITVINTYERPRTDVTLAKEIDTTHPGSVHEHLDEGTIPVTWRCEDPHTEQVHEGVLDLIPDGEAVPLLLAGEQRPPASVSCTFTEDPGVKIPAGYEDVVNADAEVSLHRAPESEPVLTVESTTIGDLTFDAENATSVVFRNTYWVEQIEPGVIKTVEGDPANRALPPETPFGFTYRCEFPTLLPGQEPPFPGEGEFSLASGQEWLPGPAPEGTTCRVTEDEPSPEVDEALAGLGLRMVPNVAHRVAEGFPDAPRIPLTDLPDGVELNAEHPRAEVFNSIFRGDGEIQIQKINPDGTPLRGAAFAIHPVAEGGDMADEPLIEDMTWDEDRFTARLTPGTYFLVETRAGEGAQLLPRPWRFDVLPADATFGDLEFTLVVDTGAAPLIAAEQSDPTDPTSPWIIRVINVAVGELPFTGGRGIWLPLLGGLGLILLGAVWFWRRG